MISTHPGELIKEFMGTKTIVGLSAELNISRVNLSKIINGRAGISAKMAMKLSKRFNTTPEFWMTLQMKYDLSKV